MSDNLAAKEATSGRDAETLQQGGYWIGNSRAPWMSCGSAT